MIADFVNHFLPDLVFQDVAIVCCAKGSRFQNFGFLSKEAAEFGSQFFRAMVFRWPTVLHFSFRCPVDGCNSQFKSNKRSEDDVEIEIRAALDAQKCELKDDSQNA